MKLSAPLYHLKRKARLLSRSENIPLHQALDRVARQEGFDGWSLLAANRRQPRLPQNCLRGWPPATSCWLARARARVKP